MNLDILNNLINNAKENNVVQSFIKELGNYLEKSTSENIANNKENGLSLLEKIQNNTNLTTEYRDKMLIERNNILGEYANETSYRGTMYYIYDKKGSDYLINACEEGKSHEIIKINENDLPQGTNVDSILREENGQYVFDEEGTEIVQEKMKEKFDELLEEQENEMQKRRIEGHLYEFVERDGNIVSLIDNGNIENGEDASNEVFEEFEFPQELLINAKEGDIFKYENGRYTPY